MTSPRYETSTSNVPFDKSEMFNTPFPFKIETL